MISWKRAPKVPQQARPGGAVRVGIARADLTPALGLPLAGYGPAILGGGHRRARGMAGRLAATALAVDRPDGRRSALVAVDLHVASRVLCERVALYTAELGLGTEDLFLGATHTHSGPGHLYGNRYYDAGTAGGPKALDDARVDTLAQRIARAVRDALDEARESHGLRAGVGVAAGALWNRSFEAFAANFLGLEEVRGGRHDRDAARDLRRAVQDWTAGGLRSVGAALADLPLERLPAEGSNERRAVNATLDVLAVHGPGGDARASLLGAVVVLHATPTLMPAPIDLLSPDVAGFAAQAVRRALGRDVPIGFLGGTLGDANVVDPDRSVDETRRLLHRKGRFPEKSAFGRSPQASDGAEARGDLLRLHARAAGALAEAVLRAIDAGAPLAPELATTYAEPDVTGAPGLVSTWDRLDGPPTSGRRRPYATGAARPGLGIAVGSDLTRTPKKGDHDDVSDDVNWLGAPVEGRRERFDPDELAAMLAGPGGPTDAPTVDAHLPKNTSGFATEIAEIVAGPDVATIPSVLPIRAWRFGAAAGPGLLLVSCPGEASVGLGFRLLRLLRARPPGEGLPPGVRLAVVGPSGEYCGYWSTLREYLRQSYEGASAWWGRDSGLWLEQRWLEAWDALRAGTTVAPAATVSFPTDSGEVERHAPWRGARAGKGSAPTAERVPEGILVRGAVGVTGDAVDAAEPEEPWVTFGATGDDTSLPCLVEVRVDGMRAVLHFTALLPASAAGSSVGITALGFPAGAAILPT